MVEKGQIDSDIPCKRQSLFLAFACEKEASFSLVELRGFEPLTSSMPRKRAPSAPQPQDSAHYREWTRLLSTGILKFFILTYSILIGVKSNVQDVNPRNLSQ